MLRFDNFYNFNQVFKFLESTSTRNRLLEKKGYENKQNKQLPQSYNTKRIGAVAILGLVELVVIGCGVWYSNKLITILGGSLFLLTIIGAAYKRDWFTTNNNLAQPVDETTPLLQ